MRHQPDVKMIMCKEIGLGQVCLMTLRIRRLRVDAEEER